MKGTVFLKPLEFNVEAVGEKWRQGETIKGSLKIKNHGNEKIEIPLLKVELLTGNYKKIKAKEKKAWDTLGGMTLAESLCLNSAEEKSFGWEFTLAEDCAVTDKNGSLYIAFFDQQDSWPVGHIELVIEPKQVIKQVLEIFENFVRFKVKEIKSAKGLVEVKLNPPASRELSNVDSLLLNLSEVNKTLTMSYLFNTRAIEMNGSSMQTQKKTREFSNTFNSRQYLIYGESLNQDFILESINSVLNEVKPRLL